MGYTLTTTVQRPYDETVQAVRTALGEQGFGVLTEIDIRATLKKQLDVDVPPQVILGACRPQLAHQAIEADPSIAALLPCNVVVRSDGEGATVVEAIDPEAMLGMSTERAALNVVACDAKERLQKALVAISG